MISYAQNFEERHASAGDRLRSHFDGGSLGHVRSRLDG